MKSFLLLALLLASCASTEIKPRMFQLPAGIKYKTLDTIHVGETHMILLKDSASGNIYLVDQSNKDVHNISVPPVIN